MFGFGKKPPVDYTGHIKDLAMKISFRQKKLAKDRGQDIPEAMFIEMMRDNTRSITDTLASSGNDWEAAKARVLQTKGMKWDDIKIYM